MNIDDFFWYLLQYWIKNSPEVCKYCSNDKPCLGNKCPNFELFNSSDKVDCMELDYGTCSYLKDTPCSTCFDYKIGLKNFNWNGVIPDEYNHI